MRRLMFALIAALAPVAASAQQFTTQPAGDVVVTLGGGGRMQPDYEGSDNYTISPFPIFKLKFLRNPFTGEPMGDTGFGIRPTFRLVPERSDSTNAALTGMNRINWAFEPGVSLDYTWTNARAFVDIRQGFGGHSGQLADFGFDAIVRPSDRLKLEFGPRLSLASDDYMKTYFGVTAAEVAVNRPVYTPSAGVRSYGLGGMATYDVNPNWLIRADAGWNHLGDDAANSPLVKTFGSAEQFSFGLGAAYRFGFNYR